MEYDLLADLLDIHEDTYEETKADRTTIIRAPFRMAGSKYYSLQHLLPKLPVRHTWCDHFLGTGIVTLNRPTSRLEVMNDRYGGVVAFYRCVREKAKCDQMLEWLKINVHSREEFYHCRDIWVHETDDVIRAAKWFYVTNISVIGKGVAFGRATHGPASTAMSYQSVLKLFNLYHSRILNVQLENLDFEQCALDYDSPDTVHYFDPPYIGTGAGVYEHSWSRDDLRRLLRLIPKLKGFCALSGYADEEIDACKWSNRHTWKVGGGAEVKAFTAENNKEGHDNRNTNITSEEVLWIKI